MPRYHNINGNQVQFTAEEEAARDAEETAWANGAFDRAIANVRSNRNRLLAETDWTALGDVTMSNNMRTYRQQLRDLPASSTPTLNSDGTLDMSSVTFPTKPS